MKRALALAQRPGGPELRVARASGLGALQSRVAPARGPVRIWLPALVLALAAAPALASDWSSFAESDVVHVVTQDADGAERDTKVWFVVVAGDGFVRTNDSRWLANIRRGSAIALRLAAAEQPVTAEEVGDAAVTAAVEAAFKEKYGFVQRVMSAFRMREPTVLRLRPAETR
jgi:hypothetical protein